MHERDSLTDKEKDRQTNRQADQGAVISIAVGEIACHRSMSHKNYSKQNYSNNKNASYRKRIV